MSTDENADLISTSDGVTHGHPNAVPNITPLLCDFVVAVSAEPARFLAEEVGRKVKELILDHIAVGIAGSRNGDSSEAIFTSINSFYHSLTMGDATGTSCTRSDGCAVFARGQTFPGPFASLLNGTFAHTLDFDDTHAEASLHPSAPVFSAALAQIQMLAPGVDVCGKGGSTAGRESDGSSEQSAGNTLHLAAIAIGLEITVRIGKVLGTAAYSRGFHSTSVAGLFGAIASLAALRGCSKSVVENAFGLAISFASGSMQYLDNGSWNKRLHPGWAAFNSFLCITLAEGGVLGATRPLEGDRGLFHSYTEKNVTASEMQAVVTDLGETWHLMTTSCKPWPCCRATHGGIQLAAIVRTRLDAESVSIAEIASIKLFMPPSHIQLVGKPTANKIQPANVVDAQFSSYYQIAVTILHGPSLGWDVYEYIGEPSVADLCRKISIIGDPGYSKMENRLEVELTNRKLLKEMLPEPLGEPSDPISLEKIHAKFMACIEPVLGTQRARDIWNAVDKLEKIGLDSVMRMAGLASS